MITGHLPELVIVLLLGLIVFGPKRVPEIAGSLGKGIRGFKKSVSDLQPLQSAEDTSDVQTTKIG